MATETAPAATATPAAPVNLDAAIDADIAAALAEIKPPPAPAAPAAPAPVTDSTAPTGEAPAAPSAPADPPGPAAKPDSVAKRLALIAQEDARVRQAREELDRDKAAVASDLTRLQKIRGAKTR